MRNTEREKLLFRYSNALQRGDFETVIAILHAAEQNAALERMLVEIDEVYLTELKNGQEFFRMSTRFKERKTMTTLTLPRPQYSYRLPLTLAVTLLIMLTIGGLLIYNFNKGTILPSAAYQTSEADNVAVFLRWNEEVWNQGNVDVLGELITVDHVRHDAGMPQDIMGIEAIAQFVTGFRLAVPDFNCVVDHVIGTGDDVWAQTTCTGTQSGNLFMPDGSVFAPSNANFTMVTMGRARFVAGKIAEIWVQYDNLGWMTQIGLLPAVPELMIEAQNSATASALIDGAWNGSNLDIVDEVYTPSVRVHFPTSYPSTMSLLNHAQWDLTFEMLHTAFPDLQVTIINQIAHGDEVVIHYTAQGTLEGEALTPGGVNMPPTGELQTWNGVFIYRFEGGKIVEEWWYWNNRFVFSAEFGQNN